MSGRNWSSANLAELEATTIYPFLAVKLNCQAAVYAWKTGTFDQTFDGATFVADGHIQGLELPPEDRTLASSPFHLLVPGADDTLRANLLNKKNFGRDAYLYIGFTDPKWTLIDTPTKWGPYRIAQPDAAISPDTHVISIALESYLVTLLDTNGLRFSSQDQKLRYAGDTFWDLLTTLKNKKMIWGQKDVASTVAAGGGTGGAGGGGGRAGIGAGHGLLQQK